MTELEDTKYREICEEIFKWNIVVFFRGKYNELNEVICPLLEKDEEIYEEIKKLASIYNMHYWMVKISDKWRINEEKIANIIIGYNMWMFFELENFKTSTIIYNFHNKHNISSSLHNRNNINQISEIRIVGIPWNDSSVKQIVGRAIRYESHLELTEPEGCDNILEKYNITVNKNIKKKPESFGCFHNLLGGNLLICGNKVSNKNKQYGSNYPEYNNNKFLHPCKTQFRPYKFKK